jgi:hypothetical protein
MTRLAAAWRALAGEQRLAAIAAFALLLTMFLPWYGLQSLNRKTGVIHSHEINAFGDVSFVEAAIFLVAAGVLAMLFARAEGRRFQLPWSDGTIIVIAGAWAALLIFYRVFSRPAGDGYPVGIEWGFFLAFVAAGALVYAGVRMRALARPQAPATRRRHPRAPAPREEPPDAEPRPRAAPGRGAPLPEEPPETVALARRARPRSAPVPARERAGQAQAPPEQLSFEDPPAQPE